MKLTVIILTILLGLAVSAEPQFHNAAPSGDSRPAASSFLRKRNVLAIEARQSQFRKTEDDATVVRQATEANQTVAVNQTAAANQTAISQADPSLRLSDSSVTIGNKTYTVQTTSWTWDTARGQCQLKGGDLASFLSYAEFQKVIPKFAGINHKKVLWVGARLWLQGTTNFIDNWYWVTGEPLSPFYKKWYNFEENMPSSGSKSRDCAIVRKDGNMKEGNGPSLYPYACSNTYYSICEIPAKPSES